MNRILPRSRSSNSYRPVSRHQRLMWRDLIFNNNDANREGIRCAGSDGMRSRQHHDDGAVDGAIGWQSQVLNVADADTQISLAVL